MNGNTPLVDQPLPSGIDSGWLSPYAGIDQSGGSTRYLPSAAYGQRNVVVSNLLKQLRGPSFADLYSSSLMDSLAGNYRSSMQDLKSNLSNRGLLGSGVDTGQTRALTGSYGKSAVGATQQGGAQEQQRKQSLLNALLGVEQQDVSNQGSLQGSSLQLKGAQAAETQAFYEALSNLIGGGIQIAATAVGGGLGAGGGLAGVGGAMGSSGGEMGSALSAGGVQGGIAGGLLGSQLSSGNYGSLVPSPGYPVSGASYPTVSQSNGGFSQYGPYAGGYSFPSNGWQIGSLS